MTREQFWREKGPALIKAIGGIVLERHTGTQWWLDRCEPTSDFAAACIIERVIERRCAERGWFVAQVLPGRWVVAAGEVKPQADQYRNDWEAIFSMAQAALVEQKGGGA